MKLGVGSTMQFHLINTITYQSTFLLGFTGLPTQQSITVKKMKVSMKISSVNVTKSTLLYGFGSGY